MDVIPWINDHGESVPSKLCAFTFALVLADCITLLIMSHHNGFMKAEQISSKNGNLIKMMETDLRGSAHLEWLV